MQFIQRHKGVILFLYVANLVVGLLVARPFYSTILSVADNSVELQRLARDFDFMTFSDFVRVNAPTLASFVSSAGVMAFFYVLLSTFFLGGLLYQLTAGQNKPFSAGEFLKACTGPFGQFLLIGIFEIFLILALLFASGIFYFVFALLAEGGTERSFLLALIPPTLLVFVLISAAIVSVDFARIKHFYNPARSAWQTFWAGIGYFFQHKRTLLTFWAFVSLSVLFTVIYVLVSRGFLTVSGMGIYLIILFQQSIVLLRTIFRVGYFANQLAYFQKNNNVGNALV